MKEQTALMRGGRLVAVALAMLVSSASAQSDPVRTGEVNDNDVYVRSGDSLNHYPICKLNAGDRVTIVGERGNWLEILPPASTFSLISADYVDTPDNKTGIVNGNNVRVRAGSLLNKNKYTVQTMLSKGAQVDILGRNPDGFLKIKPPIGATLWINNGYVSLANGTSSTPTEPTKVSAEDGASPTNPQDANARETASSSVEGADQDETPEWPFANFPPTQLRRRLVALDTDARAEVAKPVEQRDYDGLIVRYTEFTEQEDDDFTARYATTRIAQITDMKALAETVRTMRKLGDDASTKRREFMEARAAMHTATPPIPVGLDAQGELRASALYSYALSAQPRRLRLVDVTSQKNKTIGYVEIPTGMDFDVDRYLGRYVGIRAAQKRLQTGGVDPVPIYVIGELVELQHPRSEKQTPAQP